ncbi:uncharacterized protein LOC106179958 [Lingula anatina]|uniref:Uncharacterized protein LOC106179958 n=1 Tax=Lingula anatina TaxID=7574 RepID=A0A1S3K9D7_LINAN|nr:uncharacterized protein LOC106179958 [Lingula anatina]|eukprot:XP_013419240.1 uncharacterized protein LOC106179958 [Lingula anatina]
MFVSMQSVNSAKDFFKYVALELLEDKVPLLTDDSTPELLQQQSIAHLKNIAPYVLIFEKCEHIAVSEATTRNVSHNLQNVLLTFVFDVINQCPDVRIFIVSRTKFQFARLNRVYFEQSLMPLCVSDAKALLLDTFPHSDAENEGPFIDDNTLTQLAEQCARLPLALIIVGSILRDGNLSPSEMLDLMKEERLKALSDESFSDSERIDKVIRTHLARLTDVFRQHLAAIGYIPGHFSKEAVAAVLGFKQETGGGQVVKELLRVSMIQEESTGLSMAQRHRMRYDIQSLRREYLEKHVPLKELPVVRLRYSKFFADILQCVNNQMLSKNSMFATATMDVVWKNLEKLLTQAMHCTEDSYKSFIKVAVLAEYPIISFFQKESIGFYEDMMEQSRMFDGADHRHHGLMLSAYAQAVTNIEGDIQKGIDYYEKARVILSVKGTPVDMASLFQHLGWNYYKYGHLNKSQRYLHKAYKLEEEGGMHASLLMSQTLSTQGLVFSIMGEKEKAIKYFEDTLDLRISNFGEHHPSIGAVYNNMGLTYRELGEDDNALKNFECGLRCKRRCMKQANLSIVYSLSNTAMLYVKKGNFDRAMSMLQDAFSMCQKIGKTTDIALIYDDFGLVCMKKKEFPEAVDYFQKAVDIRREHTPIHFTLVEHLLHLGQAQAEQIYEAVAQLADQENVAPNGQTVVTENNSNKCEQAFEHHDGNLSTNEQNTMPKATGRPRQGALRCDQYRNLYEQSRSNLQEAAELTPQVHEQFPKSKMPLTVYKELAKLYRVAGEVKGSTKNEMLAKMEVTRLNRLGVQVDEEFSVEEV